MSGYDPKRPRRAASDTGPAPVDALIDLATPREPVGHAPGSARTATTAPAPGRPVAPVVTPTTPPAEGPSAGDGRLGRAMVIVALGALAAAVAVVVLLRRRR